MSLSTNEPLRENELLLRSVWPADRKPDMWNGRRLSSAAFKDPRGLSVSRVYNRTLEEAVCWMSSRFQGPVFSVTVFTCNQIKAEVKNVPSEYVPYHYEIHGGKDQVILSDEQALLLARSARRETKE